MAKVEEHKIINDQGDLDMDELKSTAQDWFEKNKNLIYGGITVVLILIAGLYWYFVMHKGPQEIAAKQELYKAQQSFDQDSFSLALNGRPVVAGQQGDFLGLLKIIENYGGTTSGNLAYYYAGTSFMHLNQFDQAIKFLENYSGEDDATQAMAYGMIGDAKSEKGDIDGALSYYKKAANYAPENQAISPYFLRKAGLLSEKQGKAGEAKAYYEQIKNDFPKVAVQMAIEKDIIRVSDTY